LEGGGSSAVVRGRAGQHDHEQQHCYHHAPTVKPEAATAVVELLTMAMRMPKTSWAVFKRQVINLRNCCIWLVDSFECMIMHGLANPKFMKNMSPSKFSRTATDQSDWQDESRDSGRRIKLPFMKSEVSSPTSWVNLFNSTLSPVATLIKLSIPFDFSD
jgi:hypothetical protein